MVRSKLAILVLCCAPLAFAEDNAGGQKAIDLQSVPVYLPMPSFWTHALSHEPIKSGNSELDEAYKKYFDGDMLSARAHLYKARFALRGPGDDGLRLRAASLACLVDMGEIDDTFLILKTGYKTQTDQQPDDTLLANRWKKQGGSMDVNAAPWVELFTAYQQYQRGDLESALAGWQRILKNEQYPTDARGLGGLGVIEIAGEVLVDAKRRSQTPQITRSDATKIALLTKLTFDNARWFAVGQCILLEAQIQYIDGDPAAAFSSLEGANKNFEGDRPGWVDVNLIAAIGEGRKGNMESAESALRDVEDTIPDHRVRPEQVQALAAFAKRLPAITGMDEDNRPVDLKLADAREFYRWANATGDPVLQLIAVRTLAQTLREGGYWTDATFFDALEEELGKRYRSSVPFVKRVKAAALLDYDFLVQTKFFEGHDVYPVDLAAIVNGYIAGRKGMIPGLLEYMPGMTLEQANARLEEQVAPLRDVAKQGDAAREKFRASMKSGDSEQVRQAVIDSASAQFHLISLLNILGETTHRSTTTETENTTVLHEHKQYKIQAEVTSEYCVTDRKLTRLELDQAKSCLDNAIQVVIGGIEQKENIAANGASHIIAFYEQNRAGLAPPNSLGIPVMLSGESSPFACALADNNDGRQKSMGAAEDVLKARYRKKLIPTAVASAGLNLTELNDSSSLESASDRDAIEFFEKNFVKNDAESHEDAPVVTTGQDGELPLITIKQSYKASFDLADDSEYKVAPKAATGLDIEGRAEAVRLARRHGGESPSDPRLDKLLKTLYQHGFIEGMIGQFAGTTPEQLSSRNSVFSTILNAAQMAFSLQRSDDFLMLPGRADFRTAQATLQKSEWIRRFLTAMAQVDPDASDYDAQIQDVTEQFPQIMNAADSQLADDDADIRKNSPVRALGDMTNLASSVNFRPLLFLLLDDRASADKVAGQIRNAPGAKTVDKVTGLVLYDIATGDFGDAVSQLNALPADARARDPLKFYQLDYVLGLCYRRLGNHTSEVEALNASIGELNRFRKTLVTRNEAAGFQPLRQMLYEELLGALFARKQYAEMANAIRTYKRSSQIPVSVLEQSKERDPQMTRMLDHTAFAFDTLSRDEVWKTEDLSELLPPEFAAGDKSKPVSPRDAVLAALNHMADVLIDELRGSETMTAEQAGAADRTRAALTVSYFVGTNGLYRVTERSPDDIGARFVPVSSIDLSNQTTRFRAEIQEHKDPAEAGTQLYATLLGDLADLSAVKRLNIAPDGVLNLVPFQALRNAPGAPYLIQQHSITYVTGAIANPGTSSEGRRVLLIGNPDATLPAAEDEVKAIAGIKDFQSDEPLLNTAATLSRVREQLPTATLVHFATHARANEAYPNFAFLQLAQGERMYSYDLGGMTFAGKQVFLSACETRTGLILAGDDVYGIADAFLASGASSVVATLWRIESDSSAMFAQRYYQILAETQDPSDAVAQTAREFIEGKQKVNREGTAVAVDAPIYWAAFSHLVPQGARLTH
jgi:CHAT domain-containing protein